jgi:putative ABC transport system ATP-binding protein
MLHLSKVRLGYPGAPLSTISSLTLKRGEQKLVSGASGTGKTTLLHTIAGFIPPLAGQIVIDGTDITSLSESARDRFRGRRIGMIFQNLHLVKSLSVLDNLLLSSYLTGLPQQPKTAVALLDQLGIADKRSAMPANLSRGQAQRVAIARAILNQPALILADEPTSSLDDQACQNVIQLIQQLAQQHNASLLITSHDQRLKANFAQILNLKDAS